MPSTRRRLDRPLAVLGLLAAAAASAFGMTGCTSEECTTDVEYFAQNVWAPVLSQKCIGCHNPQGQAKDSGMVLRGSSEAGFLDTNYQIVKAAASLEQDGDSQILIMPTGGSGSRKHPGGVVIKKGGPEYEALEGLLERFEEPSSCEANLAEAYEGLQYLSTQEHLRKASIAIAGRLPTADEEQSVAKGGAGAFDTVLYRLMTEEAFYTRLREIYNDLFLTDRYLNGEQAVNLLDGNYYEPTWYEALFGDLAMMKYYGARDADELENILRGGTNMGVAREPLELVVHIVRNNKSFQEILTADYIMVNPFSAKAYGTTGITFHNDADPMDFQEAKIADFPHAGVLTSPMFLNRFPTTPTNRNRARARMVYQFFLGTDILKTGEQPIDPTKIVDFNPTMNNASCTICHANIDPVAGAFVSFDQVAGYDASSKWFEDMRPPGFGGESIPSTEFGKGLQWLAPRVAKDPRFALSAVYTMYTGLTGQKPLVAPPDPKASSFDLEFKAYLAQYETFNQIAHDFVKSGYNLKTVVKGVVHTPYFRAKNAGKLTSEQRVVLKDIGMGRLLIPEALHRKIEAVLGYPWRPRAFEDNGSIYNWLLRGDAYRLLYGGIDSIDAVKRVTEPNGIMANIIDRMANEMACIVAPRDFMRPKEERILFPHVETTYQPFDQSDFEVDEAVQAIKQNIQHLHKRILGEQLAVTDPEIERTYTLFLETWQEGRKGMVDDPDTYPVWLPYSCQVHEDYWTRTELPDEDKLTDDEHYTIRAWTAVLTYLLSDYAFAYE